ncbi:unnamed protein product [Rotaria sp. Silwood2]|nr:unnamed protein product [Rotaria sp. Silwood2]CAF2716584.1 unnamed protein product [Rotaria sp. Silwood2]CAF3126045.1 unnamed protein product [Rotaria sp. Silwood2]
MNHPDIVRAFFGLNHRFNLLVSESIRHLNIPADTRADWFMSYMPRIQNTIEMIILKTESVPHIFSCTHSYPNLRSIILKNNYEFIAKLNVENCSALGAIISCLNLLRIYNAWAIDDENEQMIPLFATEPIDRDFDTKVCD